MEYKKMSIQEKTKRIVDEIQQEKGCNPVRIFKSMAQKEYISIHGPEHHILDRRKNISASTDRSIISLTVPAC